MPEYDCSTSHYDSLSHDNQLCPMHGKNHALKSQLKSCN